MPVATTAYASQHVKRNTPLSAAIVRAHIGSALNAHLYNICSQKLVTSLVIVHQHGPTPVKSTPNNFSSVYWSTMLNMHCFGCHTIIQAITLASSCQELPARGPLQSFDGRRACCRGAAGAIRVGIEGEEDIVNHIQRRRATCLRHGGLLRVHHHIHFWNCRQG